MDGMSSIPSTDGEGFFLFATKSRQALGHTQPPVKWIPWALSQVKYGQNV